MLTVVLSWYLPSSSLSLSLQPRMPLAFPRLRLRARGAAGDLSPCFSPPPLSSFLAGDSAASLFGGSLSSGGPPSPGFLWPSGTLAWEELLDDLLDGMPLGTPARARGEPARGGARR